jgi:transcriptional antiterminator NusG
MGMDEKRIDIDFEVGESVTVKEGPFANFTGKIEEIDRDKGRAKVMVNMFGRETPVDLVFAQIDKI